jgi:hypothetical protein
MTGVAVEKSLSEKTAADLGIEKCPPESGKSLVGHPGAMKFLSISRESVFQQPRLLFVLIK